MSSLPVNFGRRGASSLQQVKRTQECVYCFDPLHDPRWEEFLQKHPGASLFHSSRWLKALQKTYGYLTCAYTTSAPGEQLNHAIVFCKVRSWLTGRRLVSLPFSDHCQPLVSSEEALNVLGAAIVKDFERERWDYVEYRPLHPLPLTTTLQSTTIQYHFHTLDLTPDLDTLFSGLHKNSIQRKIRRADREGLVYREETTKPFLDHFYRLFTLTRKRHRIPPPPKKWFSNLASSFGDALKIRLAFMGNEPIAAMITIAYKDTLTYKYGCSEARFNNLGPMHLLYWKTIEDGKKSGMRILDLGRTDAGQQGLVTFKNRWGATESSITYARYGITKSSTHIFDLSTARWKATAAKQVLSCMPSSVLSKIGQTLYGHIG